MPRPVIMALKKFALLKACLVTLALCTVYVTHRAVTHRPLVVLLWTTWCGKEDYPYFKEDVVDPTCPHACIFTRERDYLYSCHALLFHGKDIRLDDMPPRRSADQSWIFFSLEPPTATPVHVLRKLDGLFNVTMTYRADSDVTTRYGYTFRARTKRKKLRHGKRSSGGSKTGPELPKTQEGRKAIAVWMVSHCDTDSRRETYVERLRDVIGVDVFGKCGDLVCQPKASDACLREAARNYSFYLSFENSICRDYVTEKFYRPLLFDIVPVVMGGANYSSLAPPGSYVDALEFESPERLGEYLAQVARRPDWYDSYFLWKEHSELKYENAACKLCSKLHEDVASGRRFTYRRFLEWFLEDAHCSNWEQVLS
ncbi:alpha-(1,3)-fucosyltransferase C-like [Dermacentor andersoni]|uniref:alpha-(1,3)-fucosyltransferase C-like n=1 Tax=Dermacentor andersoni TaxID=34620 RepID=UPI003B3A17E4